VSPSAQIWATSGGRRADAVAETGCAPLIGAVVLALVSVSGCLGNLSHALGWQVGLGLLVESDIRLLERHHFLFRQLNVAASDLTARLKAIRAKQTLREGLRAVARPDQGSL
jgi:hypothetical protein